MTSKNPSSDKPAKKPFEVALYSPPAKAAAQGRPVTLPQVEAPSLEGLSVTVAAPEAITGENLRERFVELARSFATEQPRSPDEQILMGDEVLLDLVGYDAQGQIIPFSVQTDTWVVLEPDANLPGLYEAIEGQTPGQALVVELTLPESYPVEALRGTGARFLVHVQAARQVTFPDLESPAFLQQFGRGATLDETMETIAVELRDDLAEVLANKARQQVLVEVARRTPVDIPAELVDEEIRRHWGSTEGKALLELEASDKDQEGSLQGWLTSEDTRNEVETRLRISLALGAIFKRDGLVVEKHQVAMLIHEAAEAAGESIIEAAEALESRPEDMARIDQVAAHLTAVEHVMSKAQVHFEGA